MKEGYLMHTDTSLFTRAVHDLRGAVERIDGADVDRVGSRGHDGASDRQGVRRLSRDLPRQEQLIVRRDEKANA